MAAVIFGLGFDAQGAAWKVWYRAEADWINSQLAAEKAQGWRPVSIDAYLSDPLTFTHFYVVVWRKAPGPDWWATFGVAESALNAFMQSQLGASRFPTKVAATEAPSWTNLPTTRYALVVEATGQYSTLQPTESAQQLRVLNDVYRYSGMPLRWLATFGTPSARYIGVYQKAQPYDVHWNAWPQLQLGNVDAEVNAFWNRGIRPELLASRDLYIGTALGTPGYAALWYDDHIGPHSVAILNPDNLASTLQTCAAAGFFPYRLTAGLRGYSTEFIAICMQRDVRIQRTVRIHRLVPPFDFSGFGPMAENSGSSGPRPRPGPAPRPLVEEQAATSPMELAPGELVAQSVPVRTTPAETGPVVARAPDQDELGPIFPTGGGADGDRPSGPGAPPISKLTVLGALKALDDAFLNYMIFHNIRAGSVAIAIGKKLVYATAFTNAEPGYPDTLPLSQFRMWSVSKTFTSAGIFRLMEKEDWAFGPTTPVIDIPNVRFGPNPGQLPFDPNWHVVRVKDLLTHSVNYWTCGTTSAGDECHPHWRQSPEGTSVGDEGKVDKNFAPFAPPPATKYAWVRDLTAYQDFESNRAIIEQPISWPPKYTNQNYLILAHVIEDHQQPYDYRDWMKLNVWSAVGIPTMELFDPDRYRVDVSLRDPWGAPLPYEVYLEPGTPSLALAHWNKSHLDTQPYRWNAWRYEGHGGWSAAPLDVARLYAAIGSGALLEGLTRAYMWSPTSSTFTKGGWANVFSDGKLGSSGTTFGHNGASGGGRAWASHDQSSQITIVWAVNNNSHRSSSSGEWPDIDFVTLINNVIAAGGFTEDLWPSAGLSPL